MQVLPFIKAILATIEEEEHSPPPKLLALKKKNRSTPVYRGSKCPGLGIGRKSDETSSITLPDITPCGSRRGSRRGSNASTKKGCRLAPWRASENEEDSDED